MPVNRINISKSHSTHAVEVTMHNMDVLKLSVASAVSL